MLVKIGPGIYSSLTILTRLLLFAVDTGVWPVGGLSHSRRRRLPLHCSSIRAGQIPNLPKFLRIFFSDIPIDLYWREAPPGKLGVPCAKMTLAIPGVIAGQSFLTEHRANPRAGQLQVVADISDRCL